MMEYKQLNMFEDEGVYQVEAMKKSSRRKWKPYSIP